MEDESLSCFLCEENEACLDDDEEEALLDDSNCFPVDSCLEEEEEEYIRMLLDRETSTGWFQGDRRCHHYDDDHRSLGDWIKHARLDAFSWILSVGPLSLQIFDDIGHPFSYSFNLRLSKAVYCIGSRLELCSGFSSRQRICQ